MKLYVKNTLSGLVPIFDSDLSGKKRLRLGEEYLADITRPRNYRFHKKFFALLNLGLANTEVDMPFDVYRKWVTMRAGFYKVYETPKGQIYEPESISFANMDEDAFQEVYSRVVDVIIKDLGVTAEEIEGEIMNFI